MLPENWQTISAEPPRRRLCKKATPAPCPFPSRRDIILEAIAIVLVVLWLLGMLTSYTVGGLIHILLLIAVISVLLRLISGRRV
jgi:hypothetical protein